MGNEDNFLRCASHVLDVEGELSMDPHDSGNWTGGKVGLGELKGTKHGISARQYPDVDIANVTTEQALQLYRRDYWDTIHGDDLPWPLNLIALDMSVNQAGGPEYVGRTQPAVVYLQRALGVPDDGIVGPVTKREAQASRPFHWAKFLALRAERYTETTSYHRYGHGWFIRLFLTAMEVYHGK